MDPFVVFEALMDCGGDNIFLTRDTDVEPLCNQVVEAVLRSSI
jgi:hypothetical protein